jgi:hypothetical protein
VQAGRLPGGIVIVAILGDRVLDAALTFRITEQIDVDAVLAAFEIQIDQGAGAPSTADIAGEQRLVGANLLAHDDDLVPLACRGTVARGFQTLRGLQEGILVAPDEVNLQQF